MEAQFQLKWLDYLKVFHEQQRTTIHLLKKAIDLNEERQWQINQRMVKLEERCDVLQAKIQAEKKAIRSSK